MVCSRAIQIFLRVSPLYRTLNPRVARISSTSIPSWLDPYWKLARYDKPIGTWLLYLPCTWSIALASAPGAFPDFNMLALFGVGAVLMRGAGCTVNDLLDRKLDQEVERTRGRPLAANLITTRSALGFLGLQLSASLAVLLQLNYQSISLGVLAMIPVLTYPLFKRFTHWPQLILGIAFNWGTLLGYTAVTGHLDLLTCLPLYMAGISWTLIYDTIYAFQDIEDDQRVGIKSLAIRLGDRAKTYFALFQLAMSTNMVLVGLFSEAGWLYYTGSILTMAHLARLIHKTDLHRPDSCANAFKASRNTGLMYFGTITLDKLLSAV